MFKHAENPLDVELSVPDAGYITETIGRLHIAALPPSTVNHQIESLSLEQHFQDALTLKASLGTLVGHFKAVLNTKNRAKFPATTLDDLKQSILNLQAKQHAERRQQGLRRLSVFLERFQQFGEFVQDLDGANEFMGFIWVSGLYGMGSQHCLTYLIGPSQVSAQGSSRFPESLRESLIIS